jgi:ubiquinone biosynthesis protein UbiJ
MNTTPPFSFPPLPGLSLLQNLVESVQLPDWVIDEAQNRLVLLLNHVLMQEPQAQDRIRRQQGKSARLVWGRFELTLFATPAGLLERPPFPGPIGQTPARADLTVNVTQTSLPLVLGAVVRGEKPAVSIEGDVQLAAEVAWLADNVRWDIEEDLSRVLGDAAAHTLVKALGVAGVALRSFAGRLKPVTTSAPTAS